MSEWSKSNVEEVMGILWLILSVLLKQNGIEGWWKATFVLGLVSLGASVIFSGLSIYKDFLKNKIRLAKKTDK